MAENVRETAKIFCCNPLNKEIHQRVRRSLRPVTDWMCDASDIIQKGMKICDACRKELKLQKGKETEECSVPVAARTSKAGPSHLDEAFVDLDASLEYLNKSLVTLDESPVAKKRLHAPSYCDEKLIKVKRCLQEKLLTSGSHDVHESVVENNSDSEMLKQLKEKFQEEKLSVSEKFQILTVLPKSWTYKKIMKEFGISNRMARKVKALVKEQGILATPHPKPGKLLNKYIIEKVISFYNSDDVSRLMPGKKKDFVSIKTSDKPRMHVQKRLVLGNLKELYELFKTTYPDEKIGFSKFAELRPKHCVLAGGSGTHSVCVCTTHQNVKLMIEGARLKNVRLNDGTALSDYKCCLPKIMCDAAGTACHLNECTSCPGMENLKQELCMKLEEEMIDHITYKQWVSVDRCTLETITKSTEEFVESLCERLLVLKKHSFIAKKQSEHYNYVKNVKENEAVVSLDFAENYAFVIQDEAQPFHWNNAQATIFPIAVYYKDSDDVKFKSIVCISEHLKHDTLAVRVFQKQLISYLRSGPIPDIKKIYYFSDGSAAQFKNRKNFLNLCHHESEFGIKAEWHFFATAHGKGVCDGLGGTVKRMAAKASLQHPYEDQILTPFHLFMWCQSNIKSTEFFFFTGKQHTDEGKMLEKQYQAVKPIPGTQRFHSFLPVSDTVLLTKVFSQSKESYTFSLSGEALKQTLPLAAVKGFVTCEYNDHWWLCVVLAKNETTEMVEVKFLHPQGPAPSFTYPTDCDDKLEVPVSQLLTLVDPKCPTGRTYYLRKEEMEAATRALQNYLAQDK